MTEACYPAVECPTESAVLQALAYFEVFSYPLLEEEVFAYCNHPEASRDSVRQKLQSLVNQGIVFQSGSFYQLKNDPARIALRQDFNRRADAFLPRARRMAAFIAQFPFVRSVCVSGSLSKHCMRPDSDVDFFIITEPGRLWLARTLLVLFKKIFLFNSHKYFCINYFIDTLHLGIEEKNLFTATETVTLLPMWGRDYYEAFCSANAWAWEFYPHFGRRSTNDIPPQQSGRFKRLLEKALSGRLGDWLDRKTMRFTVGYWKRKFRDMDSATFNLALKSRRGISKHHPLHFQQKVLNRFEANLQDLAQSRS